MPRTAAVGCDQSADELLLVFHHVVGRVLGSGGGRRSRRRILVVPLAGASATSPMVRMGITKVSRLVGRHLMMVRMRLVAVVQVELAGRCRRRRRRPLGVVPRQTVDGVMRMRRRRAVCARTHSTTGTHHSAYNAGMVRMMRMMSRREHSETVVQRNHFRQNQKKLWQKTF